MASDGILSARPVQSCHVDSPRFPPSGPAPPRRRARRIVRRVPGSHRQARDADGRIRRPREHHRDEPRRRRDRREGEPGDRPEKRGLHRRRGQPRAARHELLSRGAGPLRPCLLYTSDAADEEDSVDLGGRRIIKKKKKKKIKKKKITKIK